ncbi:tRNA preQ1(34) S-adenosylmethionine ribosyltransferase-isomerase QueA [Sandarakinorhabdus sp. AAP62]|uniref:tRNA preQ1(34) S-adenosylmethionine ribosyltransferase-isomerase QueA n=1 Tax=Sandarakinorhabdus sp. AAP62 TaxID=1248916 RepID=UPI0002DC0249|nr:tRNA preQ1(34) S-adenosylmethionine ribosyltransferase-isomerase QueA [Sandarakinorhabdus sp. AAP62]
MLVSDFDFHLPEDRIALRPVSPRDSARLLTVRGRNVGALDDLLFTDLPGQLRAGDVLVVNDTRVIPAQLFATVGEAAIGVTLHKRESDNRWWSFVKNARRLKPGIRVDFSQGGRAVLIGEVIEKADEGGVLWQFETAGQPLESALHSVGEMPLPPYIARRRNIDAQDFSDYQTLHAARDGAVAAPTAGLHFTPRLWSALHAAGISRETVTLHVGAGTFLPVKADKVEDHQMHAEWGSIDDQTALRLNAARATGGRIIAVGTTSLRLLESAADSEANGSGAIRAFSGDTSIFITPGYRWKAVDGLITNFHLPRSTLFMLVSALMGLDVMRSAYAHAIEKDYRFYSYGDGSLLLP